VPVAFFVAEEQRRYYMQGRKLFVGNLDYAVTREELEQLFSSYGEVREINVIEGKGFGFIEMSNQSEAEAAKKELNDSFFKGRNIRVDEAKPPRGREGRRRR
jgi:RNA recognition motif-containing protein